MMHMLQTNTFQCILATNGRRSFALFLYADGEIQWTTGDASGGVGGFGGTPAQVGFNAGDGKRFANVTGSQTSAIVNIDSTTNVDRPGVWIFRIDEEEIEITQECKNDPTGDCMFSTLLSLMQDKNNMLKRSDCWGFRLNDTIIICQT